MCISVYNSVCTSVCVIVCHRMLVCVSMFVNICAKPIIIQEFLACLSLLESEWLSTGDLDT